MGAFAELVAHVRALLAAGEWEAARLHVLSAARSVRSRSDGVLLRGIVEDVPRELWAGPEWARALGWVAYRSGDPELMAEVAARAPGAAPAFEAFLAGTRGRWDDALRLAEAGLGGPDAPVAARFRAQALRSLGGDWRPAFREALERAGGRDRGLVRLDFAVTLSWGGEDEAARAEFARAVSEVGGDPWAQASAGANLGITCLRLGDLRAAERALREALGWARREEGRRHLSLVWRGLGGVWRAHGEFPRARHAFREAERHAQSVPDRVLAMRGEARTLSLWGHSDEALAVLFEAARHADVLDEGRHPLFAEIAAERLRLGDREGARETLTRADEGRRDDARLAGVVRAELLRLEGREEEARESMRGVPGRDVWTLEVARLFPAAFALVGEEAIPPVPWTVRVSADGPVTAWMHGEALPLRPGRPAASLLALLLVRGGSVSRELALEALDLPGTGPDARRKELSRTLGELRDALGWPGAVTTDGQVIRLAPEPRWLPLELPPPERADVFCEGRLDEWVLDWRNEHGALTSPVVIEGT
ncbi:tetratricopeptide repeat protein [Deinococcus aetherius]|uniref:tetratricopeptide repeat protein n=1 Tax=Deinococcus aetherius TaxID=200252 RepID=UPI00222F1089|nr:hypothetical protein [Deinococcus aetherius]